MSQELNKELYSNIREALSGLTGGWISEVDTDSMEVIFEKWDDGYKYYKQSYTYDGQKAAVTGTPVEVVIKRSVEVVTNTSTELEKAVQKETGPILALLNKFLGKQEAPIAKGIPIVKQLDEEEMIAIEPLYINFGEIDGHGDTLESQEEVYKMVESFNQAITDGNLGSNYDHGESCDDFVALKAWVNECECYIGDELVPEGQPLVKTQFSNVEKWEERKSGELKGVSIQALAEIEVVDNE